MTIEELTGFTTEQLAAIDTAYKPTIRYIKNRVTLGNWNVTTGTYNTRTFTGTVTITGGIQELTVTEEAGTLPVGSAISKSCNFKFNNNDNLTATSFNYLTVIKVESGISTDGGSTYTYYPIGYFIIDKATSSDNWQTIEITAFDDIYGLTDTPFTEDYGDALTVFSPYLNCLDSTSASALQNITITEHQGKVLSKYTVRQALAYVAGLNAKFIKINRNGVLRLCDMVWTDEWYNHGETGYRIDFKAKSDHLIISGVRTGTKSSYSQYGTETYCYIDNPLADSNSSVAYSIYSDIYSAIPEIRYTDPSSTVLFAACEYSIGTLNSTGNPAWEVGESITFDDNFGTPHRMIICNITYNLSSGFSVEVESIEPNSELTLDGEYVTENEMQDYVDNAVSDLGFVYKKYNTYGPSTQATNLFNLQSLGSNEYTDNNEDSTKRCGIEWTFYNLIPGNSYSIDVELDFTGSVTTRPNWGTWNDAVSNLELCLIHDSYPVSSTPSGPLYYNKSGVRISNVNDSTQVQLKNLIKELHFKIVFTATSDKECIGFALKTNYTSYRYNVTTLKFKCTRHNNGYLSYYHGPLEEGIYLAYAKALELYGPTGTQSAIGPTFRRYFYAEHYYTNAPTGGYPNTWERPIYVLPGSIYDDGIAEYKDTDEDVACDADYDTGVTGEIIPYKVIRQNCDVLTLNGTKGFNEGSSGAEDAQKFRTSDISLTADALADYIKKHNSHIIYKNSTGLLAVNKTEANITSSDWQITGLYLRGYKYLKCYIKSGNDSGTPANNSAPAIITISLEDEMKTAGGYFCGSAMVSNINSPGTYTMFTVLVNTDRDKIVFSQAYTINGTTPTAANNNNRYLWKIEAYYN